MTDCADLDQAILRTLRIKGPTTFEELTCGMGDPFRVIFRRLLALRARGDIWYTAGQGWHIKEAP